MQKSWEGLEKRILKFSDSFPEARVICIATVDNYYRVAGDHHMNVHFASTEIVKNKYKFCIQGLSALSQEAPRIEEDVHDSIKDSLDKHCFDMDMNEIRSIITTVLSPPNKPLGTGRMKGFYDPSNCPSWWRETSVPFASLNNPRAGQRRATIEDGYKLIEALQEFCEVYPPRPTKMPNRSIQFRSRFYSDLAYNSSGSAPISATISVSPTSASVSISSLTTSILSASTSTCTSLPSASTSTSTSVASASASTSTSIPSASASTTTSIPSASVSTSASVPSASASTSTSLPSASTSTSTSLPSASTSTSTSLPSASASTSTSIPSASASTTTSIPSASVSTSASVPSASASTSTSLPSASTSTSTSIPSASASTSTSIPSASTSTSTSVPSASASTSTSIPSASASTSACTSSASPPSLKQRREQLIQLAKESVKDNSVALLRLLGSGNWNELVVLSEELKPLIPVFPSSLAKEWHVPTLLNTNKRYEDFIPTSIGTRDCLATTSNGNCIFNAFSIALYGNEEYAFLLRLASIVKMADNTLQYSKYIAETFGEDATSWITSLSGTEYSVPDDLSIEERIEFLCQQEMLLTARMPFRDCTLFNMHMLSDVLQRAVINHYSKKKFAVPFMENLFPCFARKLYSAPIHIVWVPAKPSRYASIKHVVPAVCQPGPYGAHVDECAFEGLACCAFMMNANPAQSAIMVECTLCGQWVHDICMRLNISNVKEEDDFSCGCDRLVDGKFPISSKEWYRNLTIDLCKSMVDFKDVLEDSNPSLRNFIYRNSGFSMMRRNLRLGRFGPFEETIIDSILEELAKYVHVKEQALVPDIFLPEVLLRILEKQEEVNRLLAEKILVDDDC